MAIASSSPLSYIQMVTKRLNIRHYFNKILSGENVKHPKPAPDVFLAAAEELAAAQKNAEGLAKALESVAKLRADLEDMQVQLALLKAETMQNVENAKEELLDAVAENVENSRQLAAARKEMLATAAEIHREAIAARKEEFVEAVEAHKEAVAARKEELAEAMELHKETVAARKEELAASFDAKKAALAARISSLNEKIADTTSRLNSRKTIARPSILQRNPSAVSRRFADAWKELYKEWEDEKHA